MKIEAIDVEDDYRDIVQANIDNCLTKTNIGYPLEYQGKVRDRIDLGKYYALITTDRQSAFDRILASIPFKGQVLNETAAWWFKKTDHIIKSHVIDVPHPNVTIAEKANPFPIEFVVRGYVTGSSNTSLWTHYQNGVREYCGIALPEGLKKNSKLASPIITPTTKEENHDRPISPKEIIDERWMSKEHWEEASQKALDLFNFGKKESSKNGLILVDTKYEMGLNQNDEIIVLDEIHTPDSSRYWLRDTYKERLASRQEPQNIDKEFLRLWFKENCDPYQDEQLPEAPSELVVELSIRYIYLYEKITGQKFKFPKTLNINDGIKSALSIYLN
jgi:phosphoribosylaminoimidazole-succinocarboxamide synthase